MVSSESVDVLQELAKLLDEGGFHVYFRPSVRPGFCVHDTPMADVCVTCRSERQIPDIGMAVERKVGEEWQEDWMTMKLYLRRVSTIDGSWRTVENRDSVLTWGAGTVEWRKGDVWRFKW